MLKLDGIVFFLYDVCVVKAVSFHVFTSAAAGQKWVEWTAHREKSLIWIEFAGTSTQRKSP